MDSMTDNDITLPIDFNASVQAPRAMDADVTTNTTVNEAVNPGNIHTMKDHEMHISELKKENFELKLRIYFLEEKIQHSHVDSDEDAFKMNIELKVEIEKLKSELQEKRRLLVKASAAVDSLDRNNQDQIKKLRKQHNTDIEQVKQSYETQLQHKMKEYELRIHENNQLLDDGKEEFTNLQKQFVEQKEQLMKNQEQLVIAEREIRKLKENKPGFPSLEATEIQAKLQATIREKQKIIDELKSAVDVRDSKIKPQTLVVDPGSEIKLQIKGLNQKVEERDTIIADLKEKLKKSEHSNKKLRSEVDHNEKKTHASVIQKLNEKLAEKQLEIDEVQEKFRILQQNLEKAQDIIDEATLKDVEAFEEKSNALKAKDALIAELQGHLKEREIEYENLNKTIAKKNQELQKIQEVKKAQEEVGKRINEKEQELMVLTEQLATSQSKLRETSDKYEETIQKLNLDHQNDLNVKDQLIKRITENIDEKETIIQDLLVTQQNISLSSSLDGITDSKEELIQKLRDRLKERDDSIEAKIEDKFQSLREKEVEIQELRTDLRDRDRLIENINSVVQQHEYTINNMKSTITEKERTINTSQKSLENEQRRYQEESRIASKRASENEGLIEKLQRNLENREQQIENLKNVLQRKESSNVGESGLVKELSNTLKEKEKMLSELLKERSQMISLSQTTEKKLMTTLVEKEQLLKEALEKLNVVSSEKNATILRLQQQVNDLNLDVQAVENSKAWTIQEHGILLSKIKQSVAEKERTIEKLIKSGKEKDKVFLKLQECTSQQPSSPTRLEVTNLKNMIKDLNNELKQKQDIICRLEKVEQVNQTSNPNEYNVSNLEYVAELESELEHRDSLLKQAADSIEVFKAKLNNVPVLEELNKKLTETKKALMIVELENDNLKGDIVKLQEHEHSEVSSLEKQVSLLKQENHLLSLKNKSGDVKTEDQITLLRDLLQQQVEETGKLTEMLHKEREAYENAVNKTKNDSGISNVSKRADDLGLISQLRQTLEDGIIENNKLRAELHQRIASNTSPNRKRNDDHSPDHRPRAAVKEQSSEMMEEMKKLQAKLEESERWNVSLQSRVDALQPRVGGVGGSLGNLTTIGDTMNGPIDETNQEMEALRCRLEGSEERNKRLKKQIENMSIREAEHVSSNHKLNEQQKQEIVLLREALEKSNDVCADLRCALKKSESEMNLLKKEHQNEYNLIKQALEESQRFCENLQQELAKEQKDEDIQTSFGHESSIPRQPDGAQDTRGTQCTPVDNQVHKELEEMYRKNEELRRTLTDAMHLNESNNQLKQSVATSQQQNTSLKKQLVDTSAALEEMTSEVMRLQKELDSSQALNLDFASQLKKLRDQVSETGSAQEALSISRNMNEKLKKEMQRLMSLLETTSKENQRLKQAGSSIEDSKVVPINESSTTTSNGYDVTDAVPSNAEIQSLRKKLEMSEKLNSALKYELEVYKENSGKNRSESSQEPFLGHLDELREVRSRLEESIRTYEALCLQLEEKLRDLDKNGTNEEKKDIMKENKELRIQLMEFSEKMKKIQTLLEEQRIVAKKDKEQISLIHNQLLESNKVNESLRKELSIYDRVLKSEQQQQQQDDAASSSPRNSRSPRNDAVVLLMDEIRSLRKQLEASIDSNNSLRQMLQLRSPTTNKRSPIRSHVNQTSPITPPDTIGSLLSSRSPTSPLTSNKASETDVNIVLETKTLEELRQFINSSFHNSESVLTKITRMTLEEGSNTDLEGLKIELEKLRSLLFKSNMLLDRLWTQQLSSGPTAADRLTKQNTELQKEITTLKKRVLSQSKLLESTATRLESSSRMRKDVERSLFARLTETQQTLGNSRRNLQDRLTKPDNTQT